MRDSADAMKDVEMFEAGAIKIYERVHHVVKGITSFAFSDIRRLIANAVLSEDFMGL